jgi:hypothetical protein
MTRWRAGWRFEPPFPRDFGFVFSGDASGGRRALSAEGVVMGSSDEGGRPERGDWLCFGVRPGAVAARRLGLLGISQFHAEFGFVRKFSASDDEQSASFLRMRPCRGTGA